MKKLLPFVFVLATVLAFAQSDKPENCFNRIYIGAGSSLGLGANANINSNRHMPRLTYSTGITFGVRVHKNVAIETGLKYTQRNAQSYSYEPYYRELGFCQTWFAPYSVRAEYSYVDMPLQLNLSVGKKKLQGVIVAGTDFNFMVIKQVYHRFTPATSNEETEMVDKRSGSVFNITPTLGVGISYQINPLMNLRVMPMAHVQALNNSKLAGVTERLWGTGIHASLTFGIVNTCKAVKEKSVEKQSIQ